MNTPKGTRNASDHVEAHEHATTPTNTKARPRPTSASPSTTASHSSRIGVTRSPTEKDREPERAREHLDTLTDVEDGTVTRRDLVDNYGK